MRDARHLGGDGRERFAPKMLILGIPGDIAAVAFPERVVALTDRDLCGEPEGMPQASIAELRKFGLAAEHAGLMRGEIEAAELQELPMVAEAALIAGFGEDGQGIDRADSGELTQPRCIRVVGQKYLGLGLDLVALAEEAAAFGQDHPEHGDGR